MNLACSAAGDLMSLLMRGSRIKRVARQQHYKRWIRRPIHAAAASRIMLLLQQHLYTYTYRSIDKHQCKYMYVCMYVCMYMCVYINVCVCVCIQIYSIDTNYVYMYSCRVRQRIHTWMCVFYVCMYVCTHVFIYIHTHTRTHTCIFTCIYTCMYVLERFYRYSYMVLQRWRQG